ncbi:YeeE/YedE family protein [Leisingera aquaemixtae]|uniref:YeeE/YedE family protein n=1 Tax=Leisingera aquaemixtae TaxID=1396826 RepID=UPI001C96DF4E|nr:YeeE/YedE thiosulfate transporter family protein [Leisingera aquaemixtae]MBY6069413.1 YeeE/YedE family protein [Leisingera aquaemixtae]
MTGIETTFTPWMSLAGGVLIGVASVLLMAVQGRILGATGILSGLLPPSGAADAGWRVALLLGMVTGPAAVMGVTGAMPVVQVPVPAAMLAVGGFIVGIGVTFGSGCTSGHGVCGMARMSPRSAVATLTFMAVTALTVFVLRHVVGG